MRDLRRAAAVDKVSERLGVRRFGLGSFSGSVRVFDPGKLKAVVRQSAGEAGGLEPVNADPRLEQHLRRHAMKLVDGTVPDAIATVATVAAAMWLPFRDGTAKHAWKLHVRLDFDAFVPDADTVELTDARNSGKRARGQERREARPAHEARARLLLRDGPPVRPVHALQRDRRRPPAATSAA